MPDGAPRHDADPTSQSRGDRWAGLILGALAALTGLSFAVVLAARVAHHDLWAPVPPLGPGGAVSPRLAQPLGYWNAMGIVGVIAATINVGAATHLRRRWARALAAAAVPVIAGATYLTFSRGAATGAAIAAACLVLLAGRRWSTLAVLAAVSVGSAVAIGAIGADPAVTDGTSAGSGATTVGILFGAAVAAVCTALLGRTRLDAVRMPRRVTQAAAVVGLLGLVAAAFAARDARSLPLEGLADRSTGELLWLLAPLAAAAMLLAFGRWSARTPAAQGLSAASIAALTALMIGCGLDWYWEIPGVRAIAFVVLGAGLLPIALRERTLGARRWRRLAAAALPALAWVLAATQLVPSDLDRHIAASQTAMRASDLRTARSRADDAIRAAPTRPAGYVQRALVDERAGSLGTARRALSLALRHAPGDWHLLVLLARIHAEAGQPYLAYGALAQAERSHPTALFLAPRLSPVDIPGRPRPCAGNTQLEQRHCERLPRADGSWERPGDHRLPGAHTLPQATLNALSADATSKGPRLQRRARLLTRILTARPPVPAPPTYPTPAVPGG